MSSVPSYAEFSKPFNKLLNADYAPGKLKLGWDTPESDGLKFNVDGEQDVVTGKTAGSLGCSMQHKNFVLKEKWSTSNNIKLILDAALDDSGLKGSVETDFSSYTGGLSTVLKGSLERDWYNINLDCSVPTGKTIGSNINFAATCFKSNFGFAYKVGVNTQSLNCIGSGLGLSYKNNDVSVFLGTNNFSGYNASMLKTVSDRLDAGLHLGWASGEPAITLGAAFSYLLDPLSQFKAKYDNKGQLGMVLVHKLRPEISVSFSTQIQTRHLSEGNHKMGVGMFFEK